MTPTLRAWVLVATVGLATLALSPATAHADVPSRVEAIGVVQTSPTSVPGLERTTVARAGKPVKVGGCDALSTLDPLSACNPVTGVIAGIPGALAGVPGAVAGAVASGVMDQVAQWMVDAASTINTFVVRQEGHMTTPELQSSWYQAEFAQLAALGAGLAALVAVIAIASAAFRRDAEGLGEVVYGMFRAGFGTGVVIAVTVLAIGVADGISNAVAASMSHQFFRTLSGAWAAKGFGGFGSAALAFLVALFQVIAALFVWLELLVRDAAIYVAVLFFPVALAAGIWPALRQWVRRLSMLLLMFVVLKPVILIVLALAGNAATAGLSFGYGGALQSVGTILVGVVIYAIAAFSPWTLMFLLGTEVGAMRGGRGPAGSGPSSTRSGDDSGGAELAGSALGGELAPGGAAVAEPELGTLGKTGAAVGSLGGVGSLAAGAGAVAPALVAAAGAVHQVGTRVAGATAARLQVASGRSGFVPAIAGASFSGSGNGSATSGPPPALATPSTGWIESAPESITEASRAPAADPGPVPAEAPIAAQPPSGAPAPVSNAGAHAALGRDPADDPNADARNAFGSEE
jgi:hypothetical protein